MGTELAPLLAARERIKDGNNFEAKKKEIVTACRSMHKRAAKWLNDGATRTARGVARF